MHYFSFSTQPSDWKPCCSSCSPSQCPLAGTYHSNEELFRGLRRLAETHPDHVKTFQVGESVKGSPLLGIRFGPDTYFSRLTDFFIALLLLLLLLLVVLL